MAAQGQIPNGVATTTPFNKSRQLCHVLSAKKGNGDFYLESADADRPWLPGHPQVSLGHDDVVACLRRELCTPKLDRMYPYLWLVGTQSSTHVSSLTEQVVRGRDIVITEDPELHLVWVNNRVFLKPLPLFLCSHDLWSSYLSDQPRSVKLPTEGLRRAALGYMRTYYYLIRHESDFRMALEAHLVPEHVEFAPFMKFISSFGANLVLDEDVTLRYRYGQLRLTRLNLWAILGIGKWVFHKVQWQYADVFAQFYAPIILAFGFLSVILAAMQVGSQARPAWEAFASVSAWFAVACLLFVAVVAAAMVFLLVFMVSNELAFAVRAKIRKARPGGQQTTNKGSRTV